MPFSAWRRVARWLLVLPVAVAAFWAAYIGMFFLFALTAHWIASLDASGLNLPVSALISAQGILGIYVALAIWLVPIAWAVGFASRFRAEASCACGFALALIPTGVYVWSRHAPSDALVARVAVVGSGLLLLLTFLLHWRHPAHRKLYALAIPLALLLLLTPTFAAIVNAPKLPPAPRKLWSATLQRGTWNEMNTGSEFSATRQMVIVGDRLIAVYDAGSAHYQGKQPMSNYRLVSLDLQSGQLRNENTFVGKWGAMPELYATLGGKLIIANGSLREFNPDIKETGRHFEVSHGRMDQISPDGRTMAWETFPGMALIDTSTLAVLPVHIDASVGGSVSNNAILTNNMYWIKKYPSDHAFITRIDSQGDHLIFHGDCAGPPQFLSDDKVLTTGCGRIRILDANGTILHEVALPGNSRFAGVSRNCKRFAVVVSESQGDPSVVLYEHFYVFDTETAQLIAMIRSGSLPVLQSWSAFSADGNLFATGSPASVNLYQLPTTPLGLR